MGKMKMSEIRIKESFARTTPRKEKLDECKNNWMTNHCQDRYLVVNHNNVLIDGYIQYLVLKEDGVEEAEVKISNKRRKCWTRKNRINERVSGKLTLGYRNQMTTYIFGIHPNSQSTKERVWRVPNSWAGWENDLLPGDKIFAATKYGLAPVIITRIEWLDKCPVDIPVKKVVSKVAKPICE